MTISRDEALNFSSIDAGVQSLLDQNSQANDQWLSDASAQADDMNSQLNDQSSKVEASSSDIQKATEGIQAQADQVASQADQFNDLPSEIENGLNDAKAQANQSVVGAQPAADLAQSNLEKTGSESASIGQGVSEEVQSSTSQLHPAFADAKSAADQTNASQIALLDQVSLGNSDMDLSVADANSQANDLTQQAQAEVNKAQSAVEAVQADIQALRQDVITAETIVDEEVVKRGGESKMLAVNPSASQDLAEPKTDVSSGNGNAGVLPDVQGDPETKATASDPGVAEGDSPETDQIQDGGVSAVQSAASQDSTADTVMPEEAGQGEPSSPSEIPKDASEESPKDGGKKAETAPAESAQVDAASDATTKDEAATSEDALQKEEATPATEAMADGASDAQEGAAVAKEVLDDAQPEFKTIANAPTSGETSDTVPELTDSKVDKKESESAAPAVASPAELASVDIDAQVGEKLAVDDAIKTAALSKAALVAAPIPTAIEMKTPSAAVPKPSLLLQERPINAVPERMHQPSDNIYSSSEISKPLLEAKAKDSFIKKLMRFFRL